VIELTSISYNDHAQPPDTKKKLGTATISDPTTQFRRSPLVTRISLLKAQNHNSQIFKT
jgi:hypothetical protein